MNAPSDVRATAAEEWLLGWLRVELEDPEIVASDNFLDVGGHSMTFARLNEQLHERFGVALDRKATYSEELGAAIRAARPVPAS